MSGLIQHSSASKKWYTSPAVVEKARYVLGSIDLDPASDAEADEVVRASRRYESDGLSRVWQASRVFCNPPGGKTGGQSNAALWWDKACTEYDCGRADVIFFVGFSLNILQTCQTADPRWHPLEVLHCIPKIRASYWRPGAHPEDRTQPPHPSIYMLLTDDDEMVARFAEAFKDEGYLGGSAWGF